MNTVVTDLTARAPKMLLLNGILQDILQELLIGYQSRQLADATGKYVKLYVAITVIQFVIEHITQ